MSLQHGEPVIHKDGRTGSVATDGLDIQLHDGSSAGVDEPGWSAAVVLPKPAEGQRWALITDWMDRDLRHGAFGLVSDEYVALNPKEDR